MQVWLINLDQQVQRLAFQTEQLKALQLPFVRLPACTPDDPEAQQAGAYWDSWQRPLSGAERACLISHKRAWQAVVRSGQPGLILEDDAWLSVHAPHTLAALANCQGIDHVSLEHRQRKKLLGTAAVRLTPQSHLRRLYQDRTGAAAYVLWPSGAHKLLAMAQTQCGLADALICACPGLVSHQVEPALSIQLDQSHFWGLTPPIQTTSAISPTAPGAKTARQWGQRWRRWAAQWAMGWRHLRHALQAQRRMVHFKPDQLWQAGT